MRRKLIMPKFEDANIVAICALDGDRLCGLFVNSIESIDENEAAAEATAPRGKAASNDDGCICKM